MKRERGATLIELVVSIVILSIGVTAIMMVVYQTSSRSADPLVRSQAISIATAYMEEILAQPLTDPAGGDTGGPEPGESRASYDDVTDYHGLSDTSGAVDQAGNSIAGLEGYNVSISVTGATLNGDPARRIAISVTYDGDADFAFPLAAFRLN